MKTYTAQRLAIAGLTLLGMSMVIFVLLRVAPGDVVDILFATAGYVNPSEKQAILKDLGLDQPVWVQYLAWLRQVAAGDLGKSYRYDVPAWQVVRPLIPVTIELGLLSIGVAVLLRVAPGGARAVRQETTLDYFPPVVSPSRASLPAVLPRKVIIPVPVPGPGGVPPP